MNRMEKAYRPCVLAVVSDLSGNVLVAERAEPRGAWQFPQGGIDPGEKPEEALQREIYEEIGLNDFKIIKKAKHAVFYDFPPNVVGAFSNRYVGQEQIWFHICCQKGVFPDLNKATDKEFVNIEWVTVDEAILRVVDFKKNAYIKGLELLGLIQKG